MEKRLKLRQTGQTPECFIAYEYESDEYISYAFYNEIPNVLWRSVPFETEEIIGMLRKRGWHQTDICDELAEARKFRSSEA